MTEPFAFVPMSYRVPTVDLHELVVDPAVLGSISHEMCERLRVLPVARHAGLLVVAMREEDLEQVSLLRALTGEEIGPVVADEPSLRRAIARHHGA